MATCPNCGEIVMEGDPYCPNCGTTFRWINNEEEDDASSIQNLRIFLEMAKGTYERGEYSRTFTYLFTASSQYNALSRHEKRQLGKNPMEQDWIIDFLCNAFNTHNEDYADDTIKLQKELKFILNLCTDCSLIYPTYITHCKKCGKPLKKPYIDRNPDDAREEINNILESNQVNPYHRLLLVTKALELLESDNTFLEEIQIGFGGSMTFVFKKKHEYFYTVYECWFEPDFARPDRVFYDAPYYSNYDRLLQDSSFKKIVRETEEKTGYTFIGCRGGYGVDDFDLTSEDIIFTDDFRVFARFKIDDKNIAVYDIDFEKMELINERIYYDY